MDEDDFDGGRRLDKNHGFMKAIVKNQIDRDEYHKFMEEKRQKTEKNLRDLANAAKETQRESIGKKRRTLPSGTKLYVPPHLRNKNGGGGECSSNGDLEADRKRRSECPGVVSSGEEDELREKARSRFRAQLAELPTMEFGKSPSSSTQSQPVKALFLLNLVNNDGDNVEVAVMSTDNAARLSKALSRKYGYTEEQTRMLRITLENELDKRLTQL